MYICIACGAKCETGFYYTNPLIKASKPETKPILSHWRQFVQGVGNGRIGARTISQPCGPLKEIVIVRKILEIK